ncbi:hypothetical protein BI036_gp223 [Morganella phage vB_MmoM_MP1]|uniref:Uncharacterized protein n=1 Tax=Morganella phage vB_MmoM_MP1 TaxID=1852628 RepID=A0A192YCK4_9CAUD|nr:hypothetical protein BI036_gp223 [Morganella phage vB_MmoM_MP1]ANM46611.1 hypothetical protein MP1_gp0171 [Morganella phage vB_MmoM_MP1]QQK88266.1 hypothetical protein [Providencia phage PSTRCR_127]
MNFSTFAHLTTLLFIILKATGTIFWSWWLVFLPSLIIVGFWFLAFIFGLFILQSTSKFAMRIKAESAQAYALKRLKERGFWE